jgi:hypothetical protein
MLIIWITNLTKDNKLKYWLIVLLMPLSILTLTTIQPYYINIKANAINRNPNQQIITTQSPAMITSVLLPGTGNNAITTNTTTTLTTAATTNSIPSAQSVYTSQSITLPTSVKSFVWYIVDEAHENSVSEKHKKVSDHNPDYLPTNVVMPQGVSLSFLDADAPWDTPHPHTINILDSSSGNVVYSTGKLDYTNTSKPTILPAGKYDITDTKFPWMKGTLNVTDNKNDDNSSNLIVGGFYTPTNQVANKLDNDGGSHPGWLGYYTNEFPRNGFSIVSKYNFHYATCKYCPGGYWPDQKTADHTLIIYSTSQPLSEALSNLSRMVWNNVYI